MKDIVEAHARSEIYLHICHGDFPSSSSHWNTEEVIIVSFLFTLLN